ENMADQVVPREAGYAWNQALMDLGATVCRAKRPLCLVCPLLAECAGPRPTGSAKAPAGAFAGSRRFHRGRILDDLRDHECLALADLGQPELVERLAAEGLIEISSDGYVRLAL